MKTITRKLAPTKVFSLLSSSSRFKILQVLFKYRNSDICVQEIAQEVGLSHSATSHQLTVLERVGILETSKKGKSVCYFVNDNSLTETIENLIKEVS